MSTATPRPPSIPDHEVLRVIGRGSYGEIWLARTLTGRLRAIKVIDRANFDNDRSFQREFDGMSAFEPISRAHAGFINILHVGRGDGFFYYIMELADGVDGAQPIDVASYQPRTLKSEIDRRGRLPPAECIALGLSLTDALDRLHTHGLIHRDIKPANLIFVHGAPKLADIGLVTASGQHSFVGTEGYVPPEGQGTPQADIYSLGKVLYEITMGKDRLDFPEMATLIDEIPERSHVQGLNDILLRACAAKPTRRYTSARDMHADLLRLQGGRRPRTISLVPALVTIALLAAVALGIWGTTRQVATPPPVVVSTPVPTPAPPPVLTGTLTVSSEPAGGTVTVIRDGKPVRTGTTPLSIDSLLAGDYEIRGELGFASVTDTVHVEPGGQAATTLQFPTGNGAVKITSDPGGARVFEGDIEVLETPGVLEEVTPGSHRYRIQLDGYKEVTVETVVHPEEQVLLPARLEHDLGPEPGKPWLNSLGMPFIPVGDVRFCRWETRVKDYAAYCAATGRASTTPDFTQTEDDPVVLVNWQDAMDFCAWLTEKERRERRISDRQSYRLPTDEEWSLAIGLPAEGGTTPEKRDGRFHKVYPWGRDWPPPQGAGNYADQSLKKGGIPGYTDGFPQTSPVGRFTPSATGLFDLGGNVWEWCLDGYKGGTDPHDWGVLRGGSYANPKRTEIESSYRNVVSREGRDVIYGFRCVLATE